MLRFDYYFRLISFNSILLIEPNTTTIDISMGFIVMNGLENKFKEKTTKNRLLYNQIFRFDY